MPKCSQIVNGIPYTGNADLDKITATIQARIASDPQFGAKYNDDSQVRNVLGAFGINEDVQTEYLRTNGRLEAATSCTGTCATMSCFWTNSIQ